MSIDEYITESDSLVIASSKLGDHDLKNNQFINWSEFPFMSRDIAVWVPSDVTVETLEAIIKDHSGELLVKGPRLFDTFTKDGKTSYAFRMVFQVA